MQLLSGIVFDSGVRGLRLNPTVALFVSTSSWPSRKFISKTLKECMYIVHVDDIQCRSISFKTNDCILDTLLVLVCVKVPFNFKE